MGCPPSATIVDYLAGRLDPDARAELAAHAADCAPCRVALSELVRADGDAGPPTRALAPGASVGRYVITSRLGAGAMGAVYAARDSQLDRSVAVKVLHARVLNDGGEQQLLDEARALARVSHPNVVAVYDAGLVDGRPFIVMELVDGETVRAWLARAPRSWREIVRVFVDAAHGLAAAHAASLTHRDFKPENVLLAGDGRVRVTDFGLAQVASVAAEAAPGGTPAYMAPEQLRGERADARSDQFSFCVALFEALFSRRPSAGESTPGASRVPRAVRRALERGLAIRPEQRHASMRALTVELERGLRRRRTWALSAGALVLALAVGGMVYHEIPPADRPCRIESRKLGELWRERREAVRRAWLASGTPDGEAAFGALDRELTTYLRGWVTTRIGVCEDVAATDPTTRAWFQARMACLDGRRAELRALLDRPAPDRSAGVVAALPRPEDCVAPSRGSRDR